MLYKTSSNKTLILQMYKIILHQYIVLTSYSYGLQSISIKWILKYMNNNEQKLQCFKNVITSRITHFIFYTIKIPRTDSSKYNRLHVFFCFLIESIVSYKIF